MRVLMLTGEYPPMSGGIAGYTALLRDALQHRGIECVLLSDQRSSAEFRVGAWSWGIARRVRQIVASSGIDIVHIQYQAGAFNMHPALNVLPRLLRGTSVVTTFHDLRAPYLFPKAGRLRNAAIKRMARWSTSAVVTNPADERVLHAAGSRTRLIPLGSSLPPPDEQISAGRIVGFFGYPSRQKGFDTLVRAIALIPQPERPALVIAGSKPPERGSHGFFDEAAVASLAAQHKVEIQWTGYLPPQEASNVLAACGAIAFPFPHGATLRSSAMIASLQSGRPVITTHPAHPGDLLGLGSMPGMTLAESGNVTEIARLIQESMEKPSRRSELPTAFQWPEIARNHAMLYASAAGKLSP